MSEASKRSSQPPRSILIRNVLAIIAFLVVLGIAVADAEGHESHGRPVPLAICDVFGERHCADALEVSWCESRFNTDARNGQFRGLFQLGSWERRNFARGRYSSAFDQSRAAHRYFIATGRDWGAWSCKP